jgi:hypothetical protein
MGWTHDHILAAQFSTLEFNLHNPEASADFLQLLNTTIARGTRRVRVNFDGPNDIS